MTRRIAIIQGHPDTATDHFCHALAEAYASGARGAGHEVKMIQVARLRFPWLQTQTEFESGTPPAAIAEAQESIGWAEHIVVVYPLWLGTMPAILKAFFEQCFRPRFAIDVSGRGWSGLLKGRSARIVVTMGMPAFFYRWYFGAHGLKSLERSILGFAGIGPIKVTLVGRIGSLNDTKRRVWLQRLQTLGATGK